MEMFPPVLGLKSHHAPTNGLSAKASATEGLISMSAAVVLMRPFDETNTWLCVVPNRFIAHVPAATRSSVTDESSPAGPGRNQVTLVNATAELSENPAGWAGSSTIN